MTILIANAAFVVKAVNNHEALIHGLMAAILHLEAMKIDPSKPTPQSELDKLNAILDAAEAAK